MVAAYERANIQVWDVDYSRPTPFTQWRAVSLSHRADLTIDTMTIEVEAEHPLMGRLRTHRTVPVPVTLAINGLHWSGLVTGLSQDSEGGATVTVSSDTKHAHRMLARARSSSAADGDAAQISGKIGTLIGDMMGEAAQRTGLPVWLVNDAGGDEVAGEVRSEDSVADVLGPLLEGSDTFLEMRALLPGDALPEGVELSRVQGQAEDVWEAERLAAGAWPQAEANPHLKRRAVMPPIAPTPHLSWSGTASIDQDGRDTKPTSGVCWVPFDMGLQDRGYWQDHPAARVATAKQLWEARRPGWSEHVTVWKAGQFSRTTDEALSAAVGAKAVRTPSGKALSTVQEVTGYVGQGMAYAWFSGSGWVVANASDFKAEDARRNPSGGVQQQTPGIMVRPYQGRDRRDMVIFSSAEGGGLQSWQTTTTAPEAAMIHTATQLDQATLEALKAGLMTAGGEQRQLTPAETKQIIGAGRDVPEVVEAVDVSAQPYATVSGTDIAYSHLGGRVNVNAAGPFFYREQVVSAQGGGANPVAALGRAWGEAQGSTRVALTPGHSTMSVLGNDVEVEGRVIPGWVPGDRVSFTDGQTRMSEVIVGFDFKARWDAPPEVTPILGRVDNGVLDTLANRLRASEGAAQRALLASPRRVPKAEVDTVVDENKTVTSTAQRADSAHSLAVAAGEKATAAEIQAAEALTSASGKSKNFYGATTPTAPSRGDTWFKPTTGGGVSPMVWDGTRWVQAVPEVDLSGVDAELEAARRDVQTAQDRVREAQQAVDNLEAELGRQVEASQARINEAKQAVAGLEAALAKKVESSAFNAAMSEHRKTMATLDGEVKRVEDDVVSGRLVAGAVKDGVVTAPKLAAGAVVAGKIAAGAVSARELAAGAVTADSIAAGAVSTSHLQITPGNLFPDPHFKDPCWAGSGPVRSTPANDGELTFFPDGTQLGLYYQPEGLKDKSMLLEPATSYRLTATVWRNNVLSTDTISVYIRAKNRSSVTKITRLGTLPVGGNGLSFGMSTILTTPEDMQGPCTIGFFVQPEAKDGGRCSIWDVQLVRAADASLIVDGAIQAQHLSAGSVTARELAAGAVTTDQLAAGAVTASKIKAGEVTSDKLTIADGFIKNAMIGDAQVTSAKIANIDAGKITTGTLDAGRIAADSISVRELRAGSIVPLGTSLIADEPESAGGVPRPVWWQNADWELAADYSGWPRPNGHTWRTCRAGMGKYFTKAVPRRLMKVQPGKAYRLRFWARATQPGTRIYIEMRNQDGQLAVQSGAVANNAAYTSTTGTHDGWEGTKRDYTGSKTGVYLVSDWEMPTTATLVETLIEFKPGTEYVYLHNIYWNHPNGSAQANQWLAGLTLDLDVIDQAQVDAAQDEQLAKLDETYAAITNDLTTSQKIILASVSYLSEIVNKLRGERSGVDFFGQYDDPGRSANGLWELTKDAIFAAGTWVGTATYMRVTGNGVMNAQGVVDIGANRRLSSTYNGSTFVWWQMRPATTEKRALVPSSTNWDYPQGSYTAIPGMSTVAPSGTIQVAVEATVTLVNVKRGEMYGIRIMVGEVEAAKRESAYWGPVSAYVSSNTTQSISANVDAKPGDQVAVQVYSAIYDQARRRVASANTRANITFYVEE